MSTVAALAAAICFCGVSLFLCFLLSQHAVPAVSHAFMLVTLMMSIFAILGVTFFKAEVWL